MSADISSNRPSLGPQNSSVAQLTHELVIGGVTPFTTIDFPGRLAAVLYTQGCAWRCRYCHNTHLQAFQSHAVVPFSKVRQFLEARKGLLDGVVFCGGEPTLQRGLLPAMAEVKALGFQVALHTAGMSPENLRETLPLCDWVGMDVKAPFHRYESITQVKNSGDLAKQSLQILLESGIPYEVRNTWHPALLSEAHLMEMAAELKQMGVQNFVLQIFQPRGCSDEALKAAVITPEAISEGSKRTLSALFHSFQIRGRP